MATVLVLVRHGETDWNRDGRLQGHRDIALNDTGRRHAAEAGRRLRTVVGSARLPDLHYVSSPLRRARDTMALLRTELALVPEDAFATDERLTELRFGTWEGLTWPQVRALDPAGARARTRHVWSFAPPGGESYAQLGERLERWLAGLTEDAVVVSHGGVVRALLVLRAGVPPQEAGGFEVTQGRVLVLADGRADWV